MIELPDWLREGLFWIVYHADTGEYTGEELLSMFLSIDPPENEGNKTNKHHGDILEEVGWYTVPIKTFWTLYHIKDIGKNYVLLTDTCPQDKHYGDGDILKIMLDIGRHGETYNDPDDIRFRETCKRIVKYAKKHNICPEMGVSIKIQTTIGELIKIKGLR